jgi:GcrA cell cycle regulator
MAFIWTEERVEVLKELWSDGWTASKIAERLPTSRNAIIGKVHRLGLPPRAISFRKKSGPKGPRNPATKVHNYTHKVFEPRQETTARKALRQAFADSVSDFADSYEHLDRLGFGAHRSDAPKPLPPQRETDIPRIATVDLEPHHCKWVCAPAGHIDTKVHCGCKTVPGLPYCRDHAVRAYRPPEADKRGQGLKRFRLEDLDTFARSRPRFINHKETA